MIVGYYLPDIHIKKEYPVIGRRYRSSEDYRPVSVRFVSDVPGRRRQNIVIKAEEYHSALNSSNGIRGANGCLNFPRDPPIIVRRPDDFLGFSQIARHT